MKTKKKGGRLKSGILFFVCTLLIIATAYLGFSDVVVGPWHIKSFDQTITKGLDLQGGVSVVMEIQDEDVTNEDLEKTKQQLELRVNKIGVSETSVTTEGDRRIRVDIPGKYDSSNIISTLSQTGELTFKSPNGEVLLTGSDVEKASVGTNSQTGAIEVNLEFNSDGQGKFADATSTYLGQTISICMDDDVLSSPSVSAAITDGKAVITGSYTIDEAKNLAGLINAGALPVTLKTASVQTVGSQLGASAMPNAIKAGAIGIALVFIFMIVYYGLPGVISCIALTLYMTLVLFVYGEVGATLTLPGIAAFLLTIGMAVDANVLIFERMREELKKGVSVKTSVKRGFENAMSSIIDSNITTIIAALVLYFFGSGSVRGFAVTLLIGIITSLFTALIVTRFLINQAVNVGLINKISHFRVKENKDKTESKLIKIVERKKIWFAVSLIIIIAGIGCIAFKGLNVGIDFKGGTQVVLDLGEDFDKDEVDAIVKKNASDAVTNTVNDTQYEIKSGDLDNDKVTEIVKELKEKYSIDEEQEVVVSQNEIGASIGDDLTKNSIIALSIAFVAMLVYIAVRFQVNFGVAALIALFHDILITLSIYAIFDIPVNSPFIAAILTIVGYSINATIVIFDRVRENSKKKRRASGNELADLSITQTMARSINTGLTTLFTIVAVYICVPAVRDFAFPIVVGVVSGTYSSIFIAPSVWTLVRKKLKKNKNTTK